MNSKLEILQKQATILRQQSELLQKMLNQVFRHERNPEVTAFLSGLIGAQLASADCLDNAIEIYRECGRMLNLEEPHPPHPKLRVVSDNGALV